MKLPLLVVPNEDKRGPEVLNINALLMEDDDGPVTGKAKAYISIPSLAIITCIDGAFTEQVE